MDMYKVFIYLLGISINIGVYASHGFHSMTLKLQHPFTQFFAGPTICGKSTFVIQLLECKENICDIVL